MHPATAAILTFFEYEHLPPALQEVSRPFCELAHRLAPMETAHGAELTTALRKLLEAKDCAIRASLPVVLGEVDHIEPRRPEDTE